MGNVTPNAGLVQGAMSHSRSRAWRLTSNRQLTPPDARLNFRVADNPRIEWQIQGLRVVKDKIYLLCREGPARAGSLPLAAGESFLL